MVVILVVVVLALVVVSEFLIDLIIQWISVLANFKGNAFQLVRSGVRGRQLSKRSAKRRRRQWRRKRAITQRQSSSKVV